MAGSSDGVPQRTHARISLLAAVDQVLAVGDAEGITANRVAVDVVLSQPPEFVRTLRQGQRAKYLAARVRALLHSDRAEKAVRLADRSALIALSDATTNSPEDQAAAYASLAETYLLTGRLEDGIRCARDACSYATATAHTALLVMAQNLLAAGLVLNGEFAAAQQWRDAADSAETSVSPRRYGWAAALSDVYLAARRSDSVALRGVLDAYSASPAPGPMASAVLGLGRCVLNVVLGDYHAVIASAQALIGGLAASRAPLIIDRARALESLALVQVGDPAHALVAVAGRVSPHAHTVCFESARASAYLQLGEPRRALQVTEVCVRHTPDHSPSTLASVMLRRAVANELLGRSTSADAQYSRASHLAAELGAIAPPIGLDLAVVERLLYRLIAHEPEFGALVTARIPLDGDYPHATPPAYVAPPLSAREEVLARWLVTDLTFAEIARRLHVSPNTVKTQAKSLYRKLEVSSRADAVEALERAGLFAA